VRIHCKKVDESEELTRSQKQSLKCVLLKYNARFTSARFGFYCWSCTTNSIFSKASCSRTNKANDG
jgi:hypothetical protein